MSDDASLVRRRPGRRRRRPRRAARAPPRAAARGRGRDARPRTAGRGRRSRHVRDRAAADRRPARPGRRARVAARDPRQRLPGAAAPRRWPSPMADVPEPSAGMPVEEAIDRLVLRDWVWTALDRLSPAAAARGRAALLHRRELLRGDRRPVRRPGRHRPQPAQRRAHASSPTRCSRRPPSATRAPARAGSWRSPPASP